LTLQTARFLLKALQSGMSGKPVPGPVSYLAPLREGNFSLAKAAPAPAKTIQEFTNVDYLMKLYQYSSLVAVVNIGERFQNSLSNNGGSFDEAWNSNSLELCNAVRSHTLTFMLTNFVVSLHEVQDPAVKNVLTRVCALFALVNIVDDPQWIGLISSSQLHLAKSALIEVLNALRPDAVSLVDAFDFPDNVLNSAIGRYDGNVYEALYNAAIKSPLNQVDPFVGYNEYLRPHLDLDLIKKGNSKL